MEVDSLKFLSARTITLRLFQCNIGARKICQTTWMLKEWVRSTRLPVKLQNSLQEFLMQVFKETQLWLEKHAAMFPEIPGTNSKLHKVNRSEHLRLYYDCICWHPAKLTIDHLATAQNVIAACSDWAQMQFQFACAYAIEDKLWRDFKKVRLRVFKGRLGGHPLYDFWTNILLVPRMIERYFLEEGLLPHQDVSLLFNWALENGFFEMVLYLWNRVTPAQREYSGTLQWSRICFQARHVQVFEFLCHELCGINAQNIARITWNSFYSSLYQILSEKENDSPAARIGKDRCFSRLDFLLKHGCPLLRSALLTAQSYRALMNVFWYKDSAVFSLFVQYLNQEQLKQACEFCDQVYETNPSSQLRNFKRFLTRSYTVG